MKKAPMTQEEQALIHWRCVPSLPDSHGARQGSIK